MSKTVVGLFSTVAQAEQVKQSLVSNGYGAQRISVVANDSNTSTTGTTGATGTAEGIGEKIGSFFRSLTGGDEEAHRHYASGVSSGGALLAVTVEDSEANEVASFLKQNGAKDIEGGTQRAADSGTPIYGSSNTNTANVSGTESIPIIEEQLVVGKREVDRGGVRIFSHVTERPVEADVTLREEHINVERRPVNRPATAADFQTGTGSVIELTATGEEAVVGKSSRVVEEVLVGKQSSERTEAIHDSVRKTEVEVENISGSNTGTTGSYGTTNKKDNY